MNHYESDFCTQYSKSFVQHWVPWLDQPWEYIYIFLFFTIHFAAAGFSHGKFMSCPTEMPAAAVCVAHSTEQFLQLLEFGEGCIFQSVCVCVGANHFGLLLCMNVYYEVEAQGCNTLCISAVLCCCVKQLVMNE